MSVKLLFWWFSPTDVAVTPVFPYEFLCNSSFSTKLECSVSIRAFFKCMGSLDKSSYLVHQVRPANWNKSLERCRINIILWFVKLIGYVTLIKSVILNLSLLSKPHVIMQAFIEHWNFIAPLNRTWVKFRRMFALNPG